MKDCTYIPSFLDARIKLAFILSVHRLSAGCLLACWKGLSSERMLEATDLASHPTSLDTCSQTSGPLPSCLRLETPDVLHPLAGDAHPSLRKWSSISQRRCIAEDWVEVGSVGARVGHKGPKPEDGADHQTLVGCGLGRYLQ